MTAPTISERRTAPASAPVVAVSADTHVGPRATEDLREYCPLALRDEYDAWLAVVTEAGKASAHDHRHARQPGPHQAAADERRAWSLRHARPDRGHEP